jgi:hypothetical protein
MNIQSFAREPDLTPATAGTTIPRSDPETGFSINSMAFSWRRARYRGGLLLHEE